MLLQHGREGRDLEEGDIDRTTKWKIFAYRRDVDRRGEDARGDLTADDLTRSRAVCRVFTGYMKALQVSVKYLFKP